MYPPVMPHLSRVTSAWGGWVPLFDEVPMPPLPAGLVPTSDCLMLLSTGMAGGPPVTVGLGAGLGGRTPVGGLCRAGGLPLRAALGGHRVHCCLLGVNRPEDTPARVFTGSSSDRRPL